MKLNYIVTSIATYAETYGKAKEVVRGQRLAVPYVYASDGITLKCPYCEGLRVSSIWETWTIDLKPEDRFLLTSLTEPEAPIRHDEFDPQMATVYLCQDCGRWVAEQQIIGKDVRYALQAVGCLQHFKSPENIPTDSLVTYLALQRVRLRDLSPALFERLVGEFLKSEWKACEVVHVGCAGGSGDDGVDFVLIREDDEYLVQVKHHPRYLRNKTSIKEGVKFVRELNGVLYREGKAKGLFVTAADGYTQAAQNEVKKTRKNVIGYDLVLLERLDINRWIARQAGNVSPWRQFMKPGIWPTPPWEGLNVKKSDIDFA